MPVAEAGSCHEPCLVFLRLAGLGEGASTLTPALARRAGAALSVGSTARCRCTVLGEAHARVVFSTWPPIVKAGERGSVVALAGDGPESEAAWQERVRRALSFVGRYEADASDISTRHDEYLAEIYG